LHSSILAHHFDDLKQQKEAATAGMWLFLATEVMFFGGLFTAYLVYRLLYHDVFGPASTMLNVKIGAFNTMVLICSSLTMALGVHAAQLGKRKLMIIFMVATFALAATFLVVKGYEWTEKWHHQLVPAFNFSIEKAVEHTHYHGANANKFPMFFILYFFMTGLHAFHIIVGMGYLTFLIVKSFRGAFSAEFYTPVEMFGLYWHFVDIVWIYLFPLLYLIGLH
jgi:cytochrome c oxidase subunit 3